MDRGGKFDPGFWLGADHLCNDYGCVLLGDDPYIIDIFMLDPGGMTYELSREWPGVLLVV